jgi:hypothetical protein
MHNRLIERLATRHLISTILVSILLALGIISVVLLFAPTSLDTFGKATDIVFKVVAIVAGTIWTLNRYYVGRADAPQVRIDADVHVIPSEKFQQNPSQLALLIFRLDVVNTGKVLIPEYNQVIEIVAVRPSERRLQYEVLHKWPAEGHHRGGSIEPGSWSAVNDEVPIPGHVRAIRIYIELKLPGGITSTWHKTFDISEGKR